MATVLGFDPYATWLNVRDSERPPNPYQLLGLTVLEKDYTRIRAAAERQSATLESRRIGADQQAWQQISDELEAAISLLLDPEQKAVLDAAIKRKLNFSAAKPLPASTGAAGLVAGAVITCRHCQKENPANRRFCGSCGKPLWEQCPQCSAEVSADERFCGICGTDIHGGFQHQNEQYAARLQQARDLAAGFQYDAALSALRGLAAIDDARFEKWALQAIDEIAVVEDERKLQLDLAAKAVIKAKEMIAAYSYETAMHALVVVPEPLRTTEIKDLLKRAESSRNEILALGGEIRSAVEQKRTWDLLPKLERMLALRPNHTQAQQLANQLRDQFIKQAKKKLSEHKYFDAIESIAQIPSFARNEEAEVLSDKAKELESLMDEVRRSTLAEKASLALADKLVKIAGTNEEAVKLRSQLLQRSQLPSPDSRVPIPNFVPLPKRTMLGCPVDWLGHFTRLTTEDETHAATLREHPGQFFVALGLALQGLDQAAVQLNLAPPDKSSMLGKLSFSFSGKPGPQLAWGLDLSDYGLKAIKLSYDNTKDRKTKKPNLNPLKLEAAEFILHRIPLTHPDAEMIREELINETLKDFLARHDLKDTKVCVAISGHRVLGRFFDLPPMPAKKVAEAVLFEAKHQIPIAIEELRWAYHILDEVPVKEADAQPRRIVVVAARDVHVQQRMQAFTNAGINVDVVQSECVALHNAAVFEFFPPPVIASADGKTAEKQPPATTEADSAGSDAIALIDVGEESTNVVICTPRATWFRSFSQGGDSFTNAIVRQFQLTHAQAELLKREPARARRYYQLRDALAPLILQFGSEIERSLSNYHKVCPEHQITRAYGLGGGFQQLGLLRFLRTGK